MKAFLKMLILIAGLILMIYAFVPEGKADVLDMGGCSGAEYPCIEVTIWGTVHWLGEVQVTNAIINVRLPGGEGMGFSNSVWVDSDGSYRFDRVPVWDEVAAPYHHYEGSVDVRTTEGVTGSQSYWRTISGGVTTHSSNWVAGDSYRLDFNLDTPGDAPDTDDDGVPDHEDPDYQPEWEGEEGTTPRWGFFLIGLILFIMALTWRV